MKRHTRQCFAAHLANHWLIEPRWAERMVSEVRARGLPQLAFEDDDGPSASVDNGPGYETVGTVAVVSIDGPMSKFDSSFGGCNTIRTRAAIRAAAGDAKISAIVVRADSPGGTVDGTMELGNDIAAANAVKPVIGFCEDMTASAALWVMAQTRKLYANAPALIGSIGCYMLLVDSSKQFEADGLKTVLVGSGGMKGLGADGMPITDEQVAYLQGLIDDRTAMFVKAIAAGRGMTPAAVRALADGRVHVAAQAKQLGLIDGIKSFDEVMAEASAVRAPRAKRMAAMVDIAQAE